MSQMAPPILILNGRGENRSPRYTYVRPIGTSDMIASRFVVVVVGTLAVNSDGCRPSIPYRPISDALVSKE